MQLSYGQRRRQADGVTASVRSVPLRHFNFNGSRSGPGCIMHGMNGKWQCRLLRFMIYRI